MAYESDRYAARHRKLEPRLAAVLSYMLFLVTGIILLRVERESRFVRFHALQSIAYSSVAIVLLATLAMASLTMIASWLLIAALIVWFYLMYRAARGDFYQLPVIGWWAERNA